MRRATCDAVRTARMAVVFYHVALLRPRTREQCYGRLVDSAGGSRCVLDRPSVLLSEDIGSVLKGGAKVCQRQLVSEVLGPLVREFARNLGREGATPIQRGFDASLLGRV